MNSPAYNPTTSVTLPIAYASLSRSLWIKSSRFNQLSRMRRATNRLAGRVTQYISAIITKGAKIRPRSQLGMRGSVAP